MNRKWEIRLQVNILEILTDSLDVAEKVLDELKDGMILESLLQFTQKENGQEIRAANSGFSRQLCMVK